MTYIKFPKCTIFVWMLKIDGTIRYTSWLLHFFTLKASLVTSFWIEFSLSVSIFVACGALNSLATPDHSTLRFYHNFLILSVLSLFDFLLSGAYFFCNRASSLNFWYFCQVSTICYSQFLHDTLLLIFTHQNISL